MSVWSRPPAVGRGVPRTAAVAVLVTAGLFAAISPAAGAAAPKYDLLGTWSTGPLNGGVRAPASGTQTVTQMNMTTGVFSGTSIVSGVHFALAGTESGNSVEFTQSEGTYAAHDKIPSLSILPNGHVGGDGSFEAGEFWMEVNASSTPPSEPGPPGKEEPKGALRTPFVTVICNIFPATPSSSACTADVGDDGALGRRTPTGSVTFSSTVGTFLTGHTCTLMPAVGLGSVASCTLPFQPAPGTQQGAPLPVSARYSGDSVFSGALGNTSPVSASLGANVSEVASNGEFPVDLVNPNAGAASGNISVSTAAVASAANAGAARAALASGSFKVGRFGVKIVRLKLSSAGRATLARKKTLHVLVRVTTLIKSKKVLRSYALTLRAGKH